MPMTKTLDVVSDRRAIKTILTPTLEIAYEESGPAEGSPVVLLHGFPDDVRAYDGVAPALADAGWRVIVPYLRGYGPTRFLDPQTPRSGQQAALGQDLLDLLDALGVERAALAGYDWGGRAACIVSALWPERVASLVSIGGYNIQNIARSGEPALPDRAHRLWYNGISTPSGAAPGWRRTGGPYVGSYGNCGRRTGISTTRPTSGRRRPSTIRILSRW
jgi:pimeloyl-ACP methyl ester carboxylesterase